MPYIKNDELKELLHNFFIAGCNAGYGVEHTEDVLGQEDSAFEEYYKVIFDRRNAARCQERG